jgi:hypothetical protein
MSGLSNTIFSSFLEFVNQLLRVDGGALPVNTYEAKKFLKDMVIGVKYCILDPLDLYLLGS